MGAKKRNKTPSERKVAERSKAKPQEQIVKLRKWGKKTWHVPDIENHMALWKKCSALNFGPVRVCNWIVFCFCFFLSFSEAVFQWKSNYCCIKKRHAFSSCSPQVLVEKWKKLWKLYPAKERVPPLICGGEEWFKTSANRRIFSPWKKMLRCVEVSSPVDVFPHPSGRLRVYSWKNCLLNQELTRQPDLLLIITIALNHEPNIKVGTLSLDFVQ